jgi:hypothetical protein
MIKCWRRVVVYSLLQVAIGTERGASLGECHHKIKAEKKSGWANASQPDFSLQSCCFCADRVRPDQKPVLGSQGGTVYGSEA